MIKLEKAEHFGAIALHNYFLLLVTIFYSFHEVIINNYLP